jgi:hypothetical protein
VKGFTVAEFLNYPTLADQFRRTHDWRKFYLNEIQLSGKNESKHPLDRLAAEFRFWEAGRPYYNAYPGVTPLLTRLTLDIPMSAITVPHRSFMIRLREDDNHIDMGRGYIAQTIMFSNHMVKDVPLWSLMTMMCKPGEKTNGSILFLSMYRVEPERSLEEAHQLLLSKMDEGVDVEGVTKILKLACTVCLLGQDESLLTRDVLAKDRHEYGELDPSDPRRAIIEDRAARKGRTGFDIGRIVESSPHWRNPHPALVWTGKGSSIPKVIFRRGCVVNTKKVTTVPSEYMGQ